MIPKGLDRRVNIAESILGATGHGEVSVVRQLQTYAFRKGLIIAVVVGLWAPKLTIASIHS